MTSINHRARISGKDIVDKTILEVDIGANAVGFNEITTGLQGSLGFPGPDTIGTTQLMEPGVDTANIYSNAVGYDKLTVGLQGSLGGSPGENSIGTTQIKKPGVGSENISDNAVGFNKLTVGLQGSLGGSPGENSIGTTQIQKPGIGSSNIYDGAITQTKIANQSIGPFSRQFKSLTAPNTYAGSAWGLAFDPDNKLWHSQTTSDIYRIGTTLGNILESFPVSFVPNDVAFASDKNRLWIIGSIQNYIFEIGTTTEIVIGSIPTPSTGPVGITYADDSNRLWVSDNAQNEIYEIGTTTGNIIGSFASPTILPAGLAYVADTHHLWVGQTNNPMIYEIGTSNGAIIGSLSVNSSPIRGLAFSNDNGRVWYADPSYINEVGTAEIYNHIQPGAIGSKELSSYFIEEYKLFEHYEHGTITGVTGGGRYKEFDPLGYGTMQHVVVTGVGDIVILDHNPDVGSFKVKVANTLGGTVDAHYHVWSMRVP